MLAVVPAATVTITLPPAAIMFAGPTINGSFDMANWGTWLPSLCWLAWAVGLGLATYAYYLRRRPDCAACITAPQAGELQDLPVLLPPRATVGISPSQTRQSSARWRW
jgi:hypothetical protein